MSLIDDIDALSPQQIEYIHGTGTDIVITQIGNPTLGQPELDAADDVITALEAKTDAEINDLVGSTSRPRRHR